LGLSKQISGFAAAFKDQVNQGFMTHAKEKGLLTRGVTPEHKWCQLSHPVYPQWGMCLGVEMWSYPACPRCIEQEQRAASIDALDSLIEAVKIPEEFHNWSATGTGSERVVLPVDDNNRNMAIEAHKFAPPHWIVATGSVGVGKTSWLTALFIDLLEKSPRRYKGSVWTTETQLFNKGYMVDGPKERSAYIKGLIEAPMLLIDDLGMSRKRDALTPWQYETVNTIITERHSRHRITLITTNMMSWNAIAKRYGQHTMSRIRQATRKEKLVPMTGHDRRGRG